MPPCSLVPREYWRPQRTTGDACRPGLVVRALSLGCGWETYTLSELFSYQTTEGV